MTIACGLWVCLVGQDGNEAERLWKMLERESSQRKAQELRRAVEEASARLAKSPEDVAALIARGRALAKQGRPSEAQPDLQKAISLNRSNAEAHASLGDLHLAQERFAEARKEFGNSLRLTSNQASVLLHRGTAWERDKQVADRHARAIEDYSAALRIDVQSVPAYLARAAALEKLGHAEEEREDCDRAREKLQSFVDLYPELASKVAALREGDVKKYRETLKLAWKKREEQRDLESADPEVYALLERTRAAENLANELAEKLRPASEPDKEQLRPKVRRALDVLFDLRYELQKAELKTLERRIEAVRAAGEERVKHKTEIVETQLTQLEKGPAPRPEKKKKGKDDRDEDD